MNFDVIPVPPLMNLIPSVVYETDPSTEELSYRMKFVEEVAFILAVWDGTQVKSSFPIFGGKEMSIGFELGGEPGVVHQIASALSGTVAGNGEAHFYTAGWDDTYKKIIRKGVKCRKGIKLPYFEASPSASLN